MGWLQRQTAKEETETKKSSSKINEDNHVPETEKLSVVKEEEEQVHNDLETGQTAQSASSPVTDNVDEQQQEIEEQSVDFSTSLDPPLSCTEDFRDALLRFLDHPVFQILGIIVLILIVISGAMFFFLMMGWQAMCDTPSRMDCEPRNFWFNISIQVLNVLFTYMALESMTWRCTQFLHAMGWSCPKRSNQLGQDIFGLDSKEIWYQIPLARRRGILVCLLLNCLTQFANQTTRIIFPTYEEADVFPGNLWTNVFFASSMFFAALAGVWMIWEEHRIHKAQPDVFAPSAIMLVRKFIRKHFPECFARCCLGCFCLGCCCLIWCCGSADSDNGESGEDEELEEHHSVHMAEPADHISTPHHEHVLPVERTSARLWAL
jgi:hypothetical protein